MSAAADHTILAYFASLPVYGEVLLDDFLRQRRILVVPTIALMVAARAAGADNPNLSVLFQHPATIKWVAELDARTAWQLGETVPVGDHPAEWPVIAQVVWAAQDHDIPVLTRRPELYASQAVRVVQAP